MSDSERLNLRDLPAVEPVPLPQRFSQTLLRHANRCPRAAYLYLKYQGGTPAVELDFGTAAHTFFERAMLELIGAEEDTLYAAAEGEDPAAAAREVASLTAAMCDEVLRDHPELSLPTNGTHSRDKLREVAYHWAVGNDISPSDVAALESKFVLTLENGWTVSGKVDVATIGDDPRVGGVDDYKTSLNVPSQGDFEELFQLRLYAALLIFGQPVEKVGEEERLAPAIGSGLQWVRAREIYPRYLGDDGLRTRAMVLSRQDVLDFRNDLVELTAKLAAQLETWKFPAIPGSHCVECPCRPECPLPEHLRDHAGTINDMAEAEEAARWARTMSARVAATKKELRNFATLHGPVRDGKDTVLEFAVSESWATDWDDLELAVERARLYGEPFDLSMYRKRKVSTKFAPRKLTAAELEPAVEPTGGEDDGPDGRWGADAPF